MIPPRFAWRLISPQVILDPNNWMININLHKGPSSEEHFAVLLDRELAGSGCLLWFQSVWCVFVKGYMPWCVTDALSMSVEYMENMKKEGKQGGRDLRKKKWWGERKETLSTKSRSHFVSLRPPGLGSCLKMAGRDNWFPSGKPLEVVLQFSWSLLD